MIRNELKFIINEHQKNSMEKKLSNICQLDSFSVNKGGYLVSSLYYDDYNQSALNDKLSGVRDRKKFRIRVYNHQSSMIKLERKIKKRDLVSKLYIKISREEYDSLVNGDISFLNQKDDVVAKDFYFNYQTKNLRPRVEVEYRREAFTYRYGCVRISFDYYLKAGPYQKDLFLNGYMIPAIPHDQIILEVKFTGFIPDVIRSIIQINSLQRQALSKYVMCCVAGCR